LRVMGQKLATEHDYSRIDKSSANAESQSVQDVRQIVGEGIGGQPAARDTGLDRPPNLLGVQFIDRYFGYFVLPAMPRMCAFQENPLLGFLWHDRGRRSDTLVRTPVVGARQTVSHCGGFQNQRLQDHSRPLESARFQPEWEDQNDAKPARVPERSCPQVFVRRPNRLAERRPVPVHRDHSQRRKESLRPWETERSSA